MTPEPKSFLDKCAEASCRICGNEGLMPVLDLGSLPLSDGLLTGPEMANQEQMFPLEVAFCSSCSLVQILETIDPKVLFPSDYPYYSSFITTLLEHSRQNALELIQTRNLNANSLIVELASNDGYLLKNFVEQGVPVLGIDPAEGPARVAIDNRVPTLIEFFGTEMADRLVKDDVRADVIIGNNVLAHVADTNGFVEGIARLLKPGGVAVMEVPYVRHLIDNCEFDTIYHEHLCYFSVTALDNLFRRHRLYLNDVRQLPIHGGSLRLYVELVENVRPSVNSMLEEEQRIGMINYNYYENFTEKVQTFRKAIRDLLARLKSQGSVIAGYGAAAKGTIMLNYIGAGIEIIDFVVDRNTHKQGKLMPGVHIPIHSPEKIMQEMPDYVMILPWNFKDEIISQQAPYKDKGGKFIVPIPWPTIL